MKQAPHPSVTLEACRHAARNPTLEWTDILHAHPRPAIPPCGHAALRVPNTPYTIVLPIELLNVTTPETPTPHNATH